ncbi:AsmA-like C-terminal region-containing protein [Roseateles sp. DC23W]|uniref:AsmA-like C-terminal region-containing protein n=1 Tax=Pelomonas dachongensis TaxID=3299029 RepID=A0ABW7ELJ6_9BURK
MKKKTIALAAGGVVLALGIGMAWADWAGWPGLAARLAERAGHGLQVDGDTRVHLIWNPRLQSTQLRVLAADGQSLLDARDVQLAWRWGDLWRWHYDGDALRLRRVQAESLALDWQRDAAGRTPWQMKPSGRDRSQPTPIPTIDELIIRNGTARMDDAPLQLKADARFSTQADGRWTAGMLGTLRGQQLQLNAEAEQGLALLSGPEAGHPPVKLRAEMTHGPERLAFAGTAASLLDARALDGQLQVRGRSLAAMGKPFGLTLPTTPDFELAGRLQHASGVWQLRGIKARIGESRLGGDFAYDTRPARSQLSGMLRGGPLRLADLGPVVGADQEPSRQGRVLPDRRLDIPSLNMMDARVAVALSQLDLGTQALEPLAPVNVSVILEDGVLALDYLNAGIAGGEVSGQVRLDPRSGTPLWHVNLGVRGMAVERWLKLDAKLLTESPITGRMQGDINVQGRGASMAALLGTLDGPVRVRIENGSVSHLLTEAVGLDVAQGLGLLFRGDKNLPLHCARLDGRFQAGVLRPRTAVVDNRDSRLDLDGRVSLATESLDLRVVAQPKDFSPLSLRAPVRVQGTLSDPRVALEGKKLTGRGIAAIALGALATPAAALLAFVDPGEDVPPVDCTLSPRKPAPPARAQTEAKPVKG